MAYTTEQCSPRRSAASSSTVNYMRRTLFFVCVCVMLSTTTAAHLLVQRADSSMSNSAGKQCKVHKKTPVYQAMDRICEMCHEMFSHEKPNMRYECRSKCFRNDQFRACLEIFSGVPVEEDDSSRK